MYDKNNCKCLNRDNDCDMIHVYRYSKDNAITGVER